jgi:hypothetical protein
VQADSATDICAEASACKGQFAAASSAAVSRAEGSHASAVNGSAGCAATQQKAQSTPWQAIDEVCLLMAAFCYVRSAATGVKHTAWKRVERSQHKSLY